jgi:hypothetical protein
MSNLYQYIKAKNTNENGSQAFTRFNFDGFALIRSSSSEGPEKATDGGREWEPIKFSMRT